MSELFDTLNMIIIHFRAWMTIIIIIVQNFYGQAESKLRLIFAELALYSISQPQLTTTLHLALLGPSLLN
jgi:hypothetical protein